MSEGLIDYLEFINGAKKLAEISAEVGDSWVLRTTHGEANKETYLYKRETVSSSTTEFLTCDYNILYSHSYSVPVLYFNMYLPSGQLLSLQELWDRMPNVYQDQISLSKWSVLTQQEHPIFGVPYFYIHPCHTKDFMSKALSISSSNYLITWLSVIGPLVNLKISPVYAIKASQKKVTD